MLGHLALNFFNRQLAVRGAQNIGQAVLSQFQRDFAPHQRGKGKEARQSAFQNADIRGDAMRQEVQNALGDLQAGILLAVEFCLLLQDPKTQFVIRRMQVDDQTALQAAFDTILKILDLARRAVGGNHDLFVLIDQRIEGVEELFLRAVLAGDELHIIDHQDIDRAENLFEIHDLLVA